jgi:biopolymer transport protein ExbB
MKRNLFLITMTSLALFSNGYCEETPSQESFMMDLEKELLSLEDDLLSTEAPFLEASSPLIEIEHNQAPSEEIEFTNNQLEEKTANESLVSFLEEDSLISSTPEDFLEQELSPLLTQNTPPSNKIEISLKQVFSGSPFIYSLLLTMSLASIAICLYASLRIKQQGELSSSQAIRASLIEKKFTETSNLCKNNQTLLSRMISGGLSERESGLQTILENMKSEGKRATLSAWQQLGILQDIAIIAPMLGLLGTVVGLFYAFYDLNRSFDSIKNLLDGLGISVGTTVAGIGVAILAMILHSIMKFRLVRSLAKVEVEASSLAHLMNERN